MDNKKRIGPKSFKSVNKRVWTRWLARTASEAGHRNLDNPGAAVGQSGNSGSTTDSLNKEEADEQGSFMDTRGQETAAAPLHDSSLESSDVAAATDGDASASIVDEQCLSCKVTDKGGEREDAAVKDDDKDF